MNCFYKPFVTLFFILFHFSCVFAQKTGKIIPTGFHDSMVDSISNVDDDCPTSLEILDLESCGDYQFTLGEGQSNEDVYWYFDDGSYQDHVSYTTMHHYANHGTYAGYAQYTSDLCSTTTYNFFLIVPSCSTNFIDNQKKQESVVVFPNPVQNILTIQVDNAFQNMEFSFVNLLGQTVLIGTLEDLNNTIETTQLSEGQYQLVLKGKTVLQTKTISIVR